MIPRETVDVVIPCFNGASFIERCIESVVSQTATVNKIIFVDDGSTDDSLAIILKLQEKHSIIKVITQDNRGLAAARNKGISFSESSLIGFLDVDDYWLPSKIENQLKIFALNPKNKAIVVASNYFDEIGSSRRPGITNRSKRVITPTSLLTYRTVVPGSGSSALIPKFVLEQVGHFDETLKYGEDLDLWVRISRDFQWCISTERDVVIYSNPDGMQAQKLGVNSSFEQDSLKILDRNRREFSSIKHLVMKSFIRSISIRGRKELGSPFFISFLQLLVGTCYSLTIKIDRKYF